MTSERFLELQTRLLSRTDLRRAYRENPDAALERLGVEPQEVRQWPRWDPDTLEAQARTLLDKRWHAVQELLFSSLTDAGAQYRKRFDDYAEAFWPEGHQRHVLDAVGFAEHLSERGDRVGSNWRVNLLRFRLGTRRFRLHWVWSLPVRSRWTCGLQFLYKRANAPRQFVVYLAV